MLRKIFSLALISLFTAASAQTLQQEITVDHDVVPEPRDVSRLNLMPVVTLPQMTPPQMTFSTRPVNIAVPGSIRALDPAAYADSIYTSPWRGYATLGIMPLYNAMLSAGYKFVDNDHTRFSGALQYNGDVYRGEYPTDDDEKAYVRNHTLTLDLNLHQAIGKKSLLDAGVDFSVARYNMPAADERLKSQNMRRIGVSAIFSSSAGRDIRYSAGMIFNNFAYNNTILTEPEPRETYRPVSENVFTALGGVAKPMKIGGKAGIDATVSIVNDSRRTDATFSHLSQQYLFADNGTYTHGLVTIRPYYSFIRGNANLNIGARVEFTFNSGKAFHIAPDVKLEWNPHNIISIFAMAGGGEHQNTLRSLYGVTPYALTMIAYENSHIPITLNAGFTVGPWKGAFITFDGGYARANDWLMPVTDARYLTFFKPIDIKGFHYRITAGYTWRTIAEAKVSFEGAGRGYDKGYYLWRDRAKNVLTASLRVTPIKSLDINLAYELRSGREMIDQCASPDPLIGSYAVSYSLGCINNLSAGATYRFTPQLSFFIYGNNILCNKYRHIGLVTGQGINGLIGASYKF